MRKSLLMLIMATMLGLFALPGVASAQLEDPTAAGRGALFAKGEGSVDIDMGGRLRMRLVGDVIITDHAGDLRVDIDGGAGLEPQRAQGGTDIILDDFRGLVKVRGSDFTIHADGKVRRLVARGHGAAWLDGQGVYRTRQGDWTLWDGMVEIAPPQVVPAA
jgi:hypothetical protein